MDEEPVIDLGAFDGAIFDMDGVITRTATVHAAAWKQVFDAFLRQGLGRAAQAGRAVTPFDVHADYLRYLDGKPRLDGVRDFLASRGIVLPEGTPDDAAVEATVHGIGNRKNAAFHDRLAKGGVEVFESSVAFIRTARAAGLRTALVSASRNAAAIVAAVGLDDMFDVRVDGQDADRLGLPGKPAPDIFRHAAALLGVPPARCLGVEDARAGVTALRAGGFGLVIGVDRAGQRDALALAGAAIVVPDLAAIMLRGTEWIAAMPCDPAWMVEVHGFAPDSEPATESLFAIGNGYVGMRASLAEGNAASSPATFVAGMFDAPPDTTPALLQLPDWAQVSVRLSGQAIHLDTAETLAHRRVLDLRQAMLRREWRYRDAAGHVSRINEVRFASGADPHVLVQSITITAEDCSSPIAIDAHVPGTWAGRSSNGATIALAVAARITDVSQGTPRARDITLPYAGHLTRGAVMRLDRIVAIHTSRDAGDPAAAAREQVMRAQAVGIDALVAAHQHAWQDHWQARDIVITGDPGAQRAIRFAIYHLISAANPRDSFVSIGARALTGPGYKGHVFWDTEIFMLPFFTLAWPQAARTLLMYRHRTLPAARRRATRLGYRGALYAWESADTGDDVTPTQVTRPDGTVLRILTGEQEHHISADVAYGAWSYWQATGDTDFLRDAGAEILLETARFWASRVERGADDRYHIRNVIGPDEYHEGVDDNAYTNGMARWNLNTAERTARMLAERWPTHWQELRTRIGLEPDEVAGWGTIARGLYTGFDERTGLIEQFQGYFALEDIDLAQLPARDVPPDVVLGREQVQRSRIVKQADVVMLLCLLPEEYQGDIVAANFRYYEPRCGHGSSLSPAIHALVAARLGDVTLAKRYLRRAMDIDLGNNMGNAADGVHAAALGGLWQAIVLGFAGLRLTDHGPECHPNLPQGWGGMSFRVQWHGSSHDMHVSR